MNFLFCMLIETRHKEKQSSLRTYITAELLQKCWRSHSTDQKLVLHISSPALTDPKTHGGFQNRLSVFKEPLHDFKNNNTTIFKKLLFLFHKKFVWTQVHEILCKQRPTAAVKCKQKLLLVRRKDRKQTSSDSGTAATNRKLSKTGSRCCWAQPVWTCTHSPVHTYTPLMTQTCTPTHIHAYVDSKSHSVLDKERKRVDFIPGLTTSRIFSSMW